MSAREWKAGDVALIEAGCWANRKVALRLAEGWAHTNGVNVDGDGIVAPVRPLVVIDAEDREQIERLHTLWCKAIVSKGTSARQIDSMQAALREFVNPTPPKPDEPKGWLAAVEDVNGDRWCLHGGPIEPGLEWYSPDLNIRRSWADIAAVRILSEGVQA